MPQNSKTYSNYYGPYSIPLFGRSTAGGVPTPPSQPSKPELWFSRPTTLPNTGPGCSFFQVERGGGGVEWVEVSGVLKGFLAVGCLGFRRGLRGWSFVFHAVRFQGSLGG